ncbi:hypothetical protein CK203_026322 [Vitis vinifera]|uniref:Uncharacterized protein n=1 Tax=Vitis vinifera TaxID=29760 RepID=A0A438ILA9_VITVI|nr:hypothetical protein CK203_026322 [Vitis vinifera]
MASMFMAPTFSLLSVNRSSSGCRKPDCTPRQYHAITMRIEKPLEELYNVRVERQVSPKRLEELGFHDGRYGRLANLGDLVRYPKWFEADLFFNGPYQERYRFRAYGDD